jgi:NAD(P)-dependent dehydrogenase (short-subunit alcohol dehydrogenase family)
MSDLKGKIALVAGATRGAGRGIAMELGARGATVYCTGRSSRAAPRPRRPGASPAELEGRPETIEETAEKVTSQGGKGIPVCVDHTVPEQVEALLARIAAEQGTLDILINDVWGGDELIEWGKKVWELDCARGARLLERAVHTHILTVRHASALMVQKRAGLIVEVTDGAALYYRTNIFYDLAKTSVIRLAFGLSEELKEHGITVVAVTPGFLRSEVMLEHFGVTEANWRDGVQKDEHFAASETPRYVGRAIAALASDPEVHTRNGRLLSS